MMCKFYILLWIHQFEVCTCSVRIPDDKLLDVLLALLYSWCCIPSLWPTSFGQECSAGLQAGDGSPFHKVSFIYHLAGIEMCVWAATTGEKLDHFADALIPSYPTLELQLRMELTDLLLRCTASTFKKPFWNHCQRTLIKPTRKWKPLRWQGNWCTIYKRSDTLPVIGSTTGFTLESRHQSSILFPIWTNSCLYWIGNLLIYHQNGYWQVEIDPKDHERLYPLRVVPVQSYAFCALQCPRHFPMADGTCACWTKLGGPHSGSAFFSYGLSIQSRF